jgi:hypothetical protein
MSSHSITSSARAEAKRFRGLRLMTNSSLEAAEQVDSEAKAVLEQLR